MEAFQQFIDLILSLPGMGIITFIPLFMVFFAVLDYPFTGVGGNARGFAFAMMTGIPALLYMNISYRIFQTAGRETEWAYNFWGVGLPFVWGGLIWIFSLSAKIDTNREIEKQHKEAKKKAEALTIVKKLTKEK